MGAGGIARRGFLGAGLVGAGALAFAAAWLKLDSQGYFDKSTPVDSALYVLTPHEFAILSALTDAVITPPPGGPSIEEAQTARRLDRELFFHKGGKLVSDVKSSLALLEYLPLAELYGAKFTRLSIGEKDRFLRDCQSAAWMLQRQAYVGIRFLILFMYYTDDRTWRSIGYSGPTVREKIFEGGNRIANLPSLAQRG